MPLAFLPLDRFPHTQLTTLSSFVEQVTRPASTTSTLL